MVAQAFNSFPVMYGMQSLLACPQEPDESSPLPVVLFLYGPFMLHCKKCTCFFRGHAVAQLVEAVRYRPEGRGFDSRLT